MFRVLACLVLLAGVAPLAACINDSELPNHEREFRSQYRGPASPPSPPSPPSSQELDNRLLFGGGATLLMGAFALTFTGRRLRS